MRMLVDLKMPPEPFNTLVRNGTVGKKLDEILSEVRPEAAYFTERDGNRGAILIVEVADPSRVPAIAEPFLLTFDAEIRFRIVMSAEDLEKAGLPELGKKYG